MTKLQQRLHELTDVYRIAGESRDEYTKKAEIIARKEAIKALRDQEFDLDRFYIDEKGTASITLKVETASIIEPVKQPSHADEQEIKVLAKSLGFFEMATDETIIVTDKDPYYKYIR